MRYGNELLTSSSNRDRLQAGANAAINLHIPQNTDNFLIRYDILTSIFGFPSAALDSWAYLSWKLRHDNYNTLYMHNSDDFW